MSRSIGVLFLLILLCGGCAASSWQSKTFRPQPWYSELDPGNREIVSDWDIFDISPSNFSSPGRIVEEMRSDISGLLE